MREDAPGLQTGSIDWNRLTHEFLTFRIDAEFNAHEPHAFRAALVQPLPRFARYLLERRMATGEDPAQAARALYGFLLDKRYTERLNLLHFAFCIFEDESPLPEEILGRTPFPHEDGMPGFRHHDDPDRAVPMPEEGL